MSTDKHASPITGRDRVQTIDIIRGFALIGILLVNIEYFAYPQMYYTAMNTSIWEGFDHVVRSTIMILAEGKFYTMFSFLFGLGFVIFMDRAVAKTDRPKLLFARRLGILLIIGIIHAYLIWSGDILMTYAIAGLILLLFYNRKAKTLLVWAVVILFLSIVPTGLMVLGSTLMQQIDSNEWANQANIILKEMQEGVENSYYAYGYGTFMEVTQQRFADTTFVLSYFFFAYPMVIPLFLLGAYVGKRKILHNVSQFLPLIKKVWITSFIIGTTMTAIYYVNIQKVDFTLPSSHDLYAQFGMTIGNPALMLFYVSSIVLLLQKETWRKILKPLTPLGRMALTNYLIQSIICTLIFYSYGLGLYASITPSQYFIVVLLIIPLQMYISHLWLKRFYFGPAEWLWRTLTYGKKAKMKRNNNFEMKQAI